MTISHYSKRPASKWKCSLFKNEKYKIMQTNDLAGLKCEPTEVALRLHFDAVAVVVAAAVVVAVSWAAWAFGL